MKWLLFFTLMMGTGCLFTKTKAQPVPFILEGALNTSSGFVQLLPAVPLPSEVFQLENQSVPLQNGTFQFKGLTKTPNGFYLSYTDKNGGTRYQSPLFVLEKGIQRIHIDIDKRTCLVYNQTMTSFYKSDFARKYQRLQKDTDWFQTYSDSLQEQYKGKLPDSLSKVTTGIHKSLVERTDDLLWSVCERLNTSFYSFWLLYSHFHQHGFKPEHEWLFSQLADSIKQSDAGRRMATQLNEANVLGSGKSFPQDRYKNLTTNQLEAIRLTNKYTLVEFWWSGCGICLQHIPQLRTLHAQYAKKGFAIIGISTDKTDRIMQLEKLLKKYQFDWPEYLDENSVNADKNGILSYPTYLLLDASGKIVKNNVRLSELPLFLAKRLN